MQHRTLGLMACLAALSFNAALAQVHVDKPAPSFTLKKPDGKPLSLAALKGKVVLLDFWSPT